MRHLWTDLRVALRVFTKQPWFLLLTVGTTALGIGANTLIFSVTARALLDTVPFEEPNRLVHLLETTDEGKRLSVAFANFTDWRQQNTSFEALAAYQRQSHVLTGLDRPELINTVHASADLFSALLVQPVVGRPFGPQEDRLGGPPVAVISFGLWHRLFGGRPETVGSVIRLDGEPYEVIGIMPSGFTFPLENRGADLWLPIAQFDGGWRDDRTRRPGIHLVGRLNRNATIESARRDLGRVSQALAVAYPDTNDGVGPLLTPLRERVVRNVRPALLVLTVAVGLVLLIACVNVANLLIARGVTRGHEMALRNALGASRNRLAQQLLTESVTLGLLGGIGGLLLATLGLRLLPVLGGDSITTTRAITIDGRVLLFTLALSVISGVAFGLFPMLQLRSTRLVTALKDGTKGSSGPGRSRLRSILVVAEMALALLLLLGAAVFLQTFHSLTAEDPGFDPTGLVTFKVDLPSIDYPEDHQRRAFFDQLEEQIAALPGVTGVARTLPLMGGWYTGVVLEGRPLPASGKPIICDVQQVGTDFFRLLDMRLIRGRAFTAADRADAPPVAIIDETFAALHWPGDDAVGRRFKRGGSPDSDEPWIEIVGVVNHVLSAGVDSEAPIQLYVPASQSSVGQFHFVVDSTRADGMSLIPEIEHAVQQIDPHQPIAQPAMFEQIIEAGASTERLAARFLSVFALLALVLAAIGLYGIMAYSVAQRRREIGIRIALGASNRSIVRWVVHRGLRLAAVGIAIGMTLALAAGPLISHLLYRARPHDLPTVLIVSGTLLMVALAASLIPAYRASRIPPAEALRPE